VSGIIDDSQRLLKQQLDLLRAEIREDLRKAKEGAGFMSVGAALAAVGAVVTVFALVYLLAWLAPSLPLWACYAIVGVAVLAVGGGLVFAGARVFRSIHAVPEQSVQAIEENVKWLTNHDRNPK